MLLSLVVPQLTLKNRERFERGLRRLHSHDCWEATGRRAGCSRGRVRRPLNASTLKAPKRGTSDGYWEEAARAAATSSERRGAATVPRGPAWGLCVLLNH